MCLTLQTQKNYTVCVCGASRAACELICTLVSVRPARPSIRRITRSLNKCPGMKVTAVMPHVHDILGAQKVLFLPPSTFS